MICKISCYYDHLQQVQCCLVLLKQKLKYHMLNRTEDVIWSIFFYLRTYVFNVLTCPFAKCCCSVDYRDEGLKLGLTEGATQRWNIQGALRRRNKFLFCASNAMFCVWSTCLTIETVIKHEYLSSQYNKNLFRSISNGRNTQQKAFHNEKSIPFHKKT